jgi:hypothetical protein
MARLLCVTVNSTSELIGQLDLRHLFQQVTDNLENLKLISQFISAFSASIRRAAFFADRFG